MGREYSTHGTDEKCLQYFDWKTGRKEDLGLGVKTVLEWIIEKYDGKLWTGCIWLKIGTSGGFS
jgi:hypothetical protein